MSQQVGCHGFDHLQGCLASDQRSQLDEVCMVLDTIPNGGESQGAQWPVGTSIKETSVSLEPRVCRRTDVPVLRIYQRSRKALSDWRKWGAENIGPAKVVV